MQKIFSPKINKFLSKLIVVFVIAYILALIVPAIANPHWLWRIMFILIVFLLLEVVFAIGIFRPDYFRALFSKETIVKTKIYITLQYIVSIFLFFGAIYVFFLPVSSDLVRSIPNQDYLQTKVSKIDSTGIAGATPWFGIEYLNINGVQYSTLFNLSPVKAGNTYEITYSPDTDMVYAVSAKSSNE